MKRSFWLKRLPLVFVVVAGVWLYRGGGGLFPTERRLIWQVSEPESVRALEIQIYDGDELLKREQLSRGEHEVVQQLPLKPGLYQARVFVVRDGDRRESSSQTIEVGDQRTIISRIR